VNPELNAMIDALQLRIAALEARLDRMEAREKVMGEVKPEGGYRYFKEHSGIWKMPPTGEGLVRYETELRWRQSMFTLDQILDANTPEITAEEGEIKP